MTNNDRKLMYDLFVLWKSDVLLFHSNLSRKQQAVLVSKLNQVVFVPDQNHMGSCPTWFCALDVEL